ncbi:hypothetical protein ACFPK9_08340 [Rubritalea spongiae]|uniref:DUF5703 domain-containing protein n=1 Tax=Rubritalea spongiae TaxID=430797 RepID=A0ABW5E106_9BACT
MKAAVVASLFLTPILPAYEVHEWGTFTTVSASNGTLLAGLHVEEEHLPPFVYSHIGMESDINTRDAYNRQTGNIRQLPQNSDQIAVHLDAKTQQASARFGKGLAGANLHNVTVKMETPVIYFYGDDTPKVNVKVGFNGGTISQWYPKRKTGDTPHSISLDGYKITDSHAHLLDGLRTAVDLRKPIDFANPYQGSIEWDVNILPKDQADTALTFKPFENYTWIYPRVPNANMLKVDDEYEDYLFYRGIGNFELPATFSVDDNETLSVSNNSRDAIPFALAFENINGKFRYKNLSNIPSNSVISVSENDWISPQNQQVEVFQAMRAGLVAQGLTTDEANSMIRTWWKSYFNKPGLRVFWVVPSHDLEKILPLTLTPQPEKAVRVMVGRADILRPSFEQSLVKTVGKSSFQPYETDRFQLAYKQRLEQLITEPVFSHLSPQGIGMQTFQIKAIGNNTQQAGSIAFYSSRDVKITAYNTDAEKSWGLSGAWKILDDTSLQIDDHIFELNPKTGILTSKTTANSNWNRFEIQLKRYLN